MNNAPTLGFRVFMAKWAVQSFYPPALKGFARALKVAPARTIEIVEAVQQCNHANWSAEHKAALNRFFKSIISEVKNGKS